MKGLSFVPAKMPNEFVQEISGENFQKALYEWYNKSGMLNELRAHLRSKMLGALKDTQIDQQLFSFKHISPKTQAFNLLIAEFLMFYNYHYSLSVFSTEVAVTNILPDKEYLNPEKDTILKPVFDVNSVWDILQTIGICKGMKEGRKIVYNYFKTNPDPLLVHILKSLIHKTDPASNTSEKNKSENYELYINNKVKDLESNIETSWEKVFEKFLLDSYFSKTTAEKVVSILVNLINVEKAKLTTEFNMQMEQMQKEFEKRENDLRLSLKEERKKSKLRCSEIKQKMNNLRTDELQAIQKHITQLSELEVKLTRREANVTQNERFLQKQQQLLETSLRDLDQEKQYVAQLKRSLEEEKRVVGNVRRLLESERSENKLVIENRSPSFQINHNSGRCDKREEKQKVDIKKVNVKKSEVQEDEETVMSLQLENNKLHSQIIKQKQKIQELSKEITNFITNTKTATCINIPRNFQPTMSVTGSDLEASDLLIEKSPSATEGENSMSNYSHNVSHSQ